ncbi:MAG: Uma2 family endonuclease [Anaerolineae bacterium]|nr:Uma2 family endonuclease [Anaerolineae bacterium]
MAAQVKVRYTPQEYLALERQAEFKSEYMRGEIFAMADAGEDHNLIAVNIVSELRNQLKGRPCRVYPSDMRVWLPAYEKYTYPDVTVVCGEAQFQDAVRDTLLNPTVIIEVLSPSTEKHDRRKKFESYKSLSSVTDYILVATDEALLDHFVRQPHEQWLLTTARGRDSQLPITNIGSTLWLSEVYDKVDFAAD